MQVLFIAPVHGKKKPQLSYPYEAVNNDNSINNRETLKQNSEFLNRTLDFTRARLESVVRRPKRAGSKVCILLESAKTLLRSLHSILNIVQILRHAGIRFVHWSERVSVGARMAPCCR